MKNLMPLILIVVSVGIFFLFIDPQYKSLKELDKEVQSNKELIATALSLRQEREKLQQKFNAIKSEEKEKLQKVLPDNVDNVRLMFDIDNIAKNVGITITNTNVKETESAASGDRLIDSTSRLYSTVGLSFSVTSRYDTFKDFMQRLENSLRLVDVDNFSVSAGEGVFYNFNVSLKTYWLR